MNRQAFGKASIVFTALGILLMLSSNMAAPRAHDKRSYGFSGGVRYFKFTSFSQAPPGDDGSTPSMAMGGNGRFTPERGEVQGGGIYARTNVADPVPRPLLDFGTWQATDIVSFDPVPDGTYGRFTASILVLRIRLFSDVDGSVSTGTLRITCNIRDAGIRTGEPEGFRLTIDDSSFGEFSPLNPIAGLTSIGIEATP